MARRARCALERWSRRRIDLHAAERFVVAWDAMRNIVLLGIALFLAATTLASAAPTTASTTTAPAFVSIDVHVGRPVPGGGLELPTDDHHTSLAAEYGTCIGLRAIREEADILDIDVTASHLNR